MCQHKEEKRKMGKTFCEGGKTRRRLPSKNAPGKRSRKSDGGLEERRMNLLPASKGKRRKKKKEKKTTYIMKEREKGGGGKGM